MGRSSFLGSVGGVSAKQRRSRRRRWPAVRADDFVLPELPEPYVLRCAVRVAPGQGATGLIFRLELRRRGRVLKVLPWSRLVMHEDHHERWVRTVKSRRWAVATFLQCVVDEGYVDERDVPAKALRKP